jgi:hypothetical protein
MFYQKDEVYPVQPTLEHPEGAARGARSATALPFLVLIVTTAPNLYRLLRKNLPRTTCG